MQYNEFVIASAGAGKTNDIVERAMNYKDKKLLITTYTLENVKNIKEKFLNINGFIPSNVEIMSWFSFLLQHCVRPYQNFLCTRKADEIKFTNKNANFYIKKDDYERYYFCDNNTIYSEKLSEFAFNSNLKSSGKVISRLEKCFDYIFIDEAQDLAGYDLNFIEDILNSNIKMLIVGDSRQVTYKTNRSRKNSKLNKDMLEWASYLESVKKCILIYKNISFRCNQQICDFADLLYPNMPKTESKNMQKTDHDGIFCISKEQLNEYCSKYNPTILRYDKRTIVDEKLNVINIGLSKGITYDRIVIMPTKSFADFFKNKDSAKVTSKEKLYVAITRAKYSVTFVID
ncbi:MAG: UvrD-helicase domain-containing protein [Bacilli bacterium]